MIASRRKWVIHVQAGNCIWHFSNTKINLRRMCCKDMYVLIDLARDNPMTYFSEQSTELFDFLKADNSFPSLTHLHQLTEQFHISLG
jgi:hypothetical protein